MGNCVTGLVSYLPLCFKGSIITLSAWVFSGIVSLLIGICLGIASSRQIGSTYTVFFIRCYTYIIKGVPAYVQILIFYFIVPQMFGIHLSPFFAASCALGLCSSGYIAEIMRSQIDAVPQGQWAACVVLGYPLSSTLRRIILPQALTVAFPAIIGELEQLLKSTSLLATIGVMELTRVGLNVVSRELNPLPVYLLIAAFYLVFSAMLHLVVRKRYYGRYS